MQYINSTYINSTLTRQSVILIKYEQRWSTNNNKTLLILPRKTETVTKQGQIKWRWPREDAGMKTTEKEISIYKSLFWGLFFSLKRIPEALCTHLFRFDLGFTWQCVGERWAWVGCFRNKSGVTVIPNAKNKSHQQLQILVLWKQLKHEAAWLGFFFS